MVEENSKDRLESFKKDLREAVPERIGEEKLEFLKREEIRTMEKDIRRLREAEAEKEKERVIALKVKKGEVKIDKTRTSIRRNSYSQTPKETFTLKKGFD
jgi:hypothetical protein